MNNVMMLVLKVLLTAVVAYLGYVFIISMSAPIKFTKESAARDAVITTRLDKIKQAQDAYYRITGEYTESFDTLLALCTTESFKIENKLLVLRANYDIAIHGENPKEYGDTAYYEITKIDSIPIFDSLFARLDYPLEELRIIPFSEGKSFYMAADEIDVAGGRFQVPTYEVTAPKKYYYTGLNKKYYNPADGMQLGNISEANTDVYPVDDIFYPED
ncbi:MAG: hypothetical protein ACI959_000815 [Limisphaerales bacterium]|jgi:hypothetical protein